MQEVMRVINLNFFEKFKKNLWYRLYADDVVVVLAQSELEFFCNSLNVISNNFELIIGKKKCGIVPINNHIDYNIVKEIDGYPVLKQYCYLGVIIDSKGSIKG